MVERGQRASFENFRIEVLWRLWVAVLRIEMEVSMGNRRMNLFDKRFRSKVPLDASLPPSQFVKPWEKKKGVG